MHASAAMPRTIAHHIAGRSLDGEDAHRLPVINPCRGTVVGRVPMADGDVVHAAVTAAREAFGPWRDTPVKERVQPLYRFKQLMERHLAELAALVTEESGKTIEESEAGIRKGLEVVEYALALPHLIAGEILEVSAGVDCHTRRFPLGVVAGVTPFNFPAMVPMWMFPIAMACGNTFVLKPSEQVPCTAVRMAELLDDAGLPKGVFNVIHGDRRTVEAILRHPGIQAVAFVGSTAAAGRVYRHGIGQGKRILALGGAKNHLVVMPDADPECTAKNVVASATGCAGQRCMAASVLLAVGDVEHILRAIVKEAGGIRTGMDMGAVISVQAKQRIIGYIDRALEEGAEILLDGRNVTVRGMEAGFFVGPTILDHVRRDSICAREEIFGPVLSILRVETLEEAMAIERAVPYGNAASIYTRDGGTARYFEQHADAGMVGVNIGVPVPRDPFAFGGWNDSRFGMGDITGRDAVSFWSKTKKITRKWSHGRQADWMS